MQRGGARTEVHGGKGDVGVRQVALKVHAVGAIVQGVAADWGQALRDRLLRGGGVRKVAGVADADLQTACE